MADASVLERLLEVQAHDTTIDQLRHRRSHLPQRAELERLGTAIAAVEGQLVPVHQRLDGLGRSQRRLEDEVAGLEAKASEAERKLGSGAVTAPRELQAMQESVESLRRRARSLEDELLEIMEESETVTARSDELTAERDRLDAEAGGLRAALAEAEVAIDGDLEREQSARADQASEVPAELLATYEKLRDRLDGIGVARLDGNRCTGCHLSLPATEIDQIKRQPPDAVVRHEECGRILVRA